MLISRHVLPVLFFLLAACATAGGGPEGKAPPPQGPVAHRQILDNGVVLLSLPRPHLPMVAVEVEVEAGAAFDPTDRPGLGSFVSSLLDEGTQTRSGEEIAEALEFIGASLAIRCGRDTVNLSLRVLKRDLATGLGILADILTHPAFREEEVELVRSLIRSSLLAEEEEPGTIAAKAYRRAAFGDHPYGHPVDGDLKSVERVSREELRRFHATYYRPERTVVAMVGAVTPAEAAAALADHLAGWVVSSTPVEVIPEPRPTRRTREVIERNFTQSTILMGHTGLTRDAPDFFPALVMNHILGGGGFGSRLTTDLREQRGLVYGVSSHFGIGSRRELFTVQLATKNASAAEAERAVRGQLVRMREQGVTEAELRDAKDYLTGSFPLRLDSNAKLASYLLFMERHQLGLDYLQRFPSLVSAVTREQVGAAARRYLDPDGLIVVVVGGNGG